MNGVLGMTNSLVPGTRPARPDMGNAPGAPPFPRQSKIDVGAPSFCEAKGWALRPWTSIDPEPAILQSRLAGRQSLAHRFNGGKTCDKNPRVPAGTTLFPEGFSPSVTSWGHLPSLRDSES